MLMHIYALAEMEMAYQCSNLVAAQSRPLTRNPRLPRRIANRDMSDCCIDQPTSVRFGVQTAISGLVASVVLLSQTDMATAANISPSNISQLASVADNKLVLPSETDEQNGVMMSMRGMSVKNFDPARYAGRWFEASEMEMEVHALLKKIVHYCKK